ncbi:MAG: Ig-like domain-containing protein [Anaerolineae bacterium]|nr:Ig-like domain-containing protein [Anaerolineae bacterium]
MRRLPFLLFTLLIILSVSSLAAQEQPVSTGAALRVIDSEPFIGQELGLQSEIAFYFNRPLDCASAQSAFSITPAIEGALSCDDAESALRFTPSRPYDRAVEYTVTLGTGLVAQDGARLAEAYTLRASSVGYLAVSDFLPSDGSTEITTDAAITVIFNRPVVPLVSVEEMAALPSPIALSPEATGQGEWLNTSIYVLRPELAGGTQYTVSLRPDLQAQDGATLQEALSWSFETIAPAIVETVPQDLNTDIPLNQKIQVRFNQPIDRASAEANFYLRAANGAGTLSGTFEWAEDGAGFSFTPGAPLELDRNYAAGFNDGVKAARGDAALTGFNTWSFATVPFPAIISTDPFDGSDDVYPWGSFTINFASPMDVDTLEGKVTIDPEPWREPDYYYGDWNNSYNINFPFEPSTDYTITIAPGMKDIYGNEIISERVVRFRTAPYDPDFVLNVPGEIGFYNARAENTQLFLTHRNISRLDLSLFTVDIGAFVSAMAGDNYGAASSFRGESALLRAWQMPVSERENVRRYELLNLSSDPGAVVAAECFGAAPTRLKVGDTAIVINEPDPVRAREAPVDGLIIDQLYKDYQLPIIGGPVCANQIIWWQVRLRDERTAWVAEAIPGDDGNYEYLLDLRLAAQVTPVQMPADVSAGGALPPGVYLLRVSSPETASRGYQDYSHFLVVGTANLTIKYAVDSMLVWATDAQTGAPLANAPITIYDSSYTALGSATTDGDGLARFDLPRVNDLYVPRVAVLQTDTDFGVASVNWTDGIEPWQFGQNYTFYPDEYRAYLYTDRPIYRPDQPVYFRGIVRRQDDVTYTPPTFSSIPVKVYDNNGEVVFDESLPITPFGTFSGQFDIADDAVLGYYRVEAQLPARPGQEDYPPTAGVSFGVAEFRLPEFQVTATPALGEVVQGDTISVTIDSRYFFGGAVSNASVEYNIVSNPYFFDFAGPGFYDFIDYDYDSGSSEFYGIYGETIASGTGTTDAQGILTIEIPAALEDNSQSRTFTIEAVVSDESEQIVAGRTEVVVHKGELYIGARPENYVSTAGQEALVNLIAVDWESEGIANQAVAVEVVERRWSNVQEQDEAGRTTWTWEVEEIPVTTGSVTTDANGKASFSFVPPNGGIFKAKIKTQDAKGNEIVAATTLWVAGTDYVSWRQQNSNRIDLIADQDSYSIGDTAEILITSPFQGTTEALITIERGRVLQAERVTMTSNSTIYRVPITADFAPNVFVSVMLVKGVDENNPVAAFRAGLVQLGVDNAQKEVSISITPDREQAGPGDTVNYTVQTTDYQGNPVQAEVGVGLTDLASLSIAEPNTGPILRYFYGEQGLGVRTATPLTINVDQLTQTVLDTIKGGGGGGGEGGIFDIRQDFVDTAYWNATLVTGADGTAIFSVTLPDNLTTWRLDARAVTSGADGLTLVGQDTFDLLSTKPLLVRPVTPRFFVVGDQVTLAAVVNNNTGEEMSVEIAVQGTGLTFTDGASQTVTIPSGGRQRVNWNAVVEDAPQVDLTFFANGNNGAFTDASKPPLGQGDNQLLPVYKYEVPETVGTAGLLLSGEAVTESISLPRRFEVTQGELTIKLDSSLAATTLDGLRYLEDFPHQCIEQTVSRFLPNIMTFRALDSLGVANDGLRRSLESGVNFALQRLYAQQKSDGGWGWFVQDASNALTTAYALIGLAEARNSGFVVSEDVIRNAQRFLQTAFIVPDQSQPTWRLNRQAFMLYALARSGAPDVSRTANLFDARARLSLYAQGFLALTLNLINPADTSRSDTLLSDLVSSAILSATGAHWEEDERDYWNWNTDTRTTAIVLDALIKLRPQSELIPNAVRWLMVARTGDAWETTQETAWSVMTLTDWMVLSGELQPAYSYSASLNGEKLTEGTATPETVRDSTVLRVQVADLLAQQANALAIGRTEGAGVLYYTAHLEAYLPVPEVEALNRGIIVERRYTMSGSDAPVTEARVGDLVNVRLTIIAPNDLHYVVIEDPIPAGTEGVNPNLSTEQQIGTEPGLESDPLSYGWGWWWFSNIEFRDEKVVLYATYLPAGTYEYQYSIRAGLAGVYNVIPATGQEFYFPEVYGRSAGSTFTVLPSE